jgi:ABC-type antimicrobial peptide transport system permease subunit
VANALTRRAGEIGVRMALGASRSSVVTMAFSDTARIVVAGLAIGAPMTVVARRMITSRRYDVAASGLATIGVAMLTLTAVTAIAGIVPAYRAACIDPNIALRYD